MPREGEDAAISGGTVIKLVLGGEHAGLVSKCSCSSCRQDRKTHAFQNSACHTLLVLTAGIRLRLPFMVPSSLCPSLCPQRGRKEGAKTCRGEASRCTPARIGGGAEAWPDGLSYPPAPQRLPTPVAGTPFCCRRMPFPAWTQALLQTSLPMHSQSPGGWCSWEPGERSGEEAQGCGRRRKRGRATCQVFQRK